VNHVAVEDAQAASDVIIGMILINDNNAIVLFDYGASHSFVAGRLRDLLNRVNITTPLELR
jgi:hypothetical protein